MTTKTKTTVLEKKIQHFYDLLNRKEFAQCYGIIDPLVRANPASVTLLQYITALDTFHEAVGKVRIQQIDMELHLDEPSKLYSDRDFAVGYSVWLDRSGAEHTFQERWVRHGRSWFTRSTGFVAPDAGKKSNSKNKE